MPPSPRVPNGVYAAALTPLHADLSIDHETLAAHVRRLLTHGCDGVAVLGTTGEASSFSVEERLEIVDRLAGAGLPMHRLLVGTGACALPDAVRLTRHAVARGAAGALVVPPFYYKNVRDEGLFEAFARLIERVGGPPLRIVLYHFPRMSGVPITRPVLERLLDTYPDVVVGMKDSSGDFPHMRDLCEAYPGFQVFSGTERFLLDLLLAGGAGCITATANVTAPLAAEIFAAPDAPEATARQARLSALRGALEAFPFAPALKRLMADRTAHPGWLHVRPPLSALRPEEVAALRAAVRAHPLPSMPCNRCVFKPET